MLEFLDGVTWSLGSIAATISYVTTSTDSSKTPVILTLLTLVVLAWVFSYSNDRTTFRRGAANGIVCGLLAVPSALVALDSPLLKTGLIISVVIVIVFLLSSLPVATYGLKITGLMFVVVVGGLSSWMGAVVWVEGVAVAVSLGVVTSLMTYAPGAFTLGEFFIVATLAGLPVPVVFGEVGIARLCAVALLSAVLCLSTSLVVKKPIVVVVFVVPFVFVCHDIVETVKFVFVVRRLVLIGYCGFTCACFIFLSVFWKGLSRFPQIIQRKFFHLMALFVFIPPVLLDDEFLGLAVCGAIFVFLFVESLRITSFPGIGMLIERYVAGFVDERDSGGLILTHLFLLLGLGLPVVLAKGETSSGFLVQLCGLSVLAVGDAAASIVGVNFGRHRWPGTKKTWEGTAGAFIGTWVCLFLVQQLKEVDLSWQNIVALTIPSLIGALDEAFTTQIDNLTLPFVMIPFVMIAKLWL